MNFIFTAPTFVAPENVKFRYRLDGFDPDWSEPTTQRVAVYPRLPAGRYQFHTTVSDSDGIWNPTGTELSFEVVPVWWDSKLMRAAEFLVGGGLLAFFVRFISQRRLKRRLLRLEQDQRVADERERIARNLHDGLGAGLTHVGMMAEQLAEDCTELSDMRLRASRLVDRVQVVARDLDAAVWAVSPRHDRLPALCAYLCEYAIEFFRDTPVRCRVDVAADIPEIIISPEARHHLFLAAKEALNNTLKHAHAAQVALVMRRVGPDFVIEISDDGCGFDVAIAGSLRAKWVAQFARPDQRRGRPPKRRKFARGHHRHNSASMPITVAIVEDDAEIRAMLTQAVEKAPELAFVGSFPDGETALEKLSEAPPQVVIMDIQLPGISGIECTRRLKQSLPATQVLVFTVFADSDLVFNALAAGASGYLLKRTARRQIVEAVRQVWEGGAPMSGEIARKVVESFRGVPSGAAASPTAASADEQLTPREEEVLRLLSKGYVTKEIAEMLSISFDTVRFHLKNIYAKLHVRSRMEALVKYLR